MKQKIITAMMETAFIFSKLSYSKRKQVAAILVKDERILSIGYNGTPSGWPNECENEIDGELVTKKEVLHAEANCLSKIAKSNESSENSVLFVTLGPCIECSKLIYSAGIKKVYYHEDYRDTQGVEFLKKCGVQVIKWQKEEDLVTV